MHPFALASANDPATAIAAHADDPALPIEALPEGGCIQPPPAMATIAYDKEEVYESL